LSSRREIGRICFRRNPWPKGHAIVKFAWSGRIERATGVWFDLHLETAAYYAEDPSSGPNYCGDADVVDDIWKSKTVWRNFHSCTLSSTYWPGQAYGFNVGSKERPLDFSKLSSRVFKFDDEPNLTPPRPFGIYLTGHDDVSGHRIRFERKRRKRFFDVKWTGKIAQSYYGSVEFKHRFAALLNNVTFDGLAVPNCSSKQEAIELAIPFIKDAFLDWEARPGECGIMLFPKK